MSRWTIVAALSAVLLPPSAEAQRVPRRPRLPAEADTNDAAAYFQLGLSRAERNPGEAFNAFYWAARLDPLAPQSVYAQWVTTLMLDPRRLVQYIRRDERTLNSDAVFAIDSLRFRFEMQDPFLHRGMDETMLVVYARNAAERDAFSIGGIASGTSGVAAATEAFFENEDPSLRGQLYYSRGHLADALQYWAIALRTADSPWIHAERGRTWYEQRRADSAWAAYSAALHFAPRLYTIPHHIYESPAAWNYALGRILEDRRDTAAARQAYERALAFDDAYYAASLRLAALAIQQRDTAGAVGAIARATARSDTRFFALVAAAGTLSQLRRTDRSVPLLRRATEAEPWASAGWLALASELAAARDTTGAVAAYEKYLALAPRNDGGRPAATQALAGLRP